MKCVACRSGERRGLLPHGLQVSCRPPQQHLKGKGSLESQSCQGFAESRQKLQLILYVTDQSWRDWAIYPCTHLQQCSSVGLSCPTTAVTDLWHIRCPQHPHHHGGPAEGTSCNSHQQKRYFIRVSNDPCSHMVSSRSRVARGWLRTWGCRGGLALQVGTLSPCWRGLHTPGFQACLEPQSYTPFPLPAAVRIIISCAPVSAVGSGAGCIMGTSEAP